MEGRPRRRVQGRHRGLRFRRRACAATKAVRMLLQSAVLALGAWLVLQGS